MNLSEAIEQFLLAKDAKRLAKSTIALYEITLRQFADFVGPNRDLASIDASFFDAYVIFARTDLSPNTLRGRMEIIRMMFGFCVRRKMLDEIPAFEMPKVKEEIYRNRAMKIEDYWAIIDVAETRVLKNENDWLALRNLVMVKCLSDFACRAGGLCSLTLPGPRLDLVNREAFLIEKNEPNYIATFTEETVDLLRWWMSVRPTPPKEHGYMFVVRRRTRGPVNVGVVERALASFGDKAGVEGPCNPHAIRHMWAQLASDEGVSLEAIQHKLGHLSNRTTMLYLNQDKDRLHRATQTIASVLSRLQMQL